MMVESTRSAFANKDDVNSFSEHKEDGNVAVAVQTTTTNTEPSTAFATTQRPPVSAQRHEAEHLSWAADVNGNPVETLPPPSPVGQRNSVDIDAGASPLTNTHNAKLETIAPILLPLRKTSTKLDPLEQEQALFEQRLTEDGYGVAVRKINQNGKSNLRYVKCLYQEELEDRTSSKSTRSVGSLGSFGKRGKHSDSSTGTTPAPTTVSAAVQHTPRRVLVWGKKRNVQISVDRFTAVYKGKATDRCKRNLSPAGRLLSLLTNDPAHPSLDIEAPTRLDRDKFARAFSRFLQVPLQGDSDQMGSATSTDIAAAVVVASPTAAAAVTLATTDEAAAPAVVPTTTTTPLQTAELPPKMPQQKQVVGGAWPPPLAPVTRDSSGGDWTSAKDNSNRDSSAEPVVSVVRDDAAVGPDDDGSELSSMTGHGYDQEIVEELHQAVTELRSELADSRAEAARAVKVAEHAIQSAEKSSSQDWQNTVTHKAAEAAALAQKRSAEAMAKQRLAEERLEGERRTAAFWRRQAEVAEEEAGALQTRAAAAEVQRSAMDEELQSQRRVASQQLGALKNRFSSSEEHQQEALEAALEKNRALELELDTTRRDLATRKIQQENVENTNENSKSRKKLSLRGRKKKGSNQDSTMLLSGETTSSSSHVDSSSSLPAEGLSTEQIIKLHAETASMRKQFEMLQRATADQLRALPGDSKRWVEQIAEALQVSQSEASRLRGRLAVESASRRKLMYEVQDLRGVVRVYCRIRPTTDTSLKAARLFSLPSQETLMLHREQFGSNKDNLGPMCFDFDRVFGADARQQDIYSEVEDACLGVLDGYKICVMAYGQTGSGKTRTLLGDVKHTVMSPAGKETKVQIENHGIQLQALRQLFSVAEHRSDRYKDTFLLTIVEVHNERLCDLMSGTATADERGCIAGADSKSGSRRKSQRGEDDASSARLTKLEIRTDPHGDTAVQGVVSVEVESFEDVCSVWDECLEGRETRLAEQGLDAAEYEASSHLIATINVVSANIATGQGSTGKLQFVDLAGADLVPKRGNQQASPQSSLSGPDLLLSGVGNTTEWKFKNRSLDTLNEVVTARSQFVRKVPYRNSTLTHLLRDSLEADTKVLLLACVSSDPKDLQETASTLRFASRMRRVTIGKATKHTVSAP